MSISYFTTVRELWFLISHPVLWFRKALSKSELPADPFVQFERWYRAAERSLWWSEFPNAMVLSTVSEFGKPEGRVVLLKGYSAEGLVFYTNKDSQKGKSLMHHPQAAATFYWEKLQRQIRVEGKIVDVPAAQADAYFASRPRGSQIGAWASDQSRPIGSRQTLEDRVREYESQFKGGPVPRPPHWGGYCLQPELFEFWELRLSRLHDRLRYRYKEGGWVLDRLAP